MDKSELEAAVQEAEALKEEDYTAESWTNLQTALDAAREVLEREDAAQSDVDQALQNLNDAVDALVPVGQEEEVDKTQLEALISEAKTLVEADYTAESWRNLLTMLQYAEEILEKEDATNQEVTGAYNSLQAAIDQLEIDKTELETAIETANALNEADYTADTWQELVAALEFANEVLEKDDATVQEVKDATQRLIHAIANLATNVDKAELKAMIDLAEELQNQYTRVNWNSLNEALQTAEEVYQNRKASQEEINAAAAALKAIIDELCCTVTVNFNSDIGTVTLEASHTMLPITGTVKYDSIQNGDTFTVPNDYYITIAAEANAEHSRVAGLKDRDSNGNTVEDRSFINEYLSGTRYSYRISKIDLDHVVDIEFGAELVEIEIIDFGEEFGKAWTEPEDGVRATKANEANAEAGTESSTSYFYDYGSDITIQVEPSLYYDIKSISINGTELDLDNDDASSENPLALTNVIEKQTVKVEFVEAEPATINNLEMVYQGVEGGNNYGALIRKIGNTYVFSQPEKNKPAVGLRIFDSNAKHNYAKFYFYYYNVYGQFYDSYRDDYNSSTRIINIGESYQITKIMKKKAGTFSYVPIFDCNSNLNQTLNIVVDKQKPNVTISLPELEAGQQWYTNNFQFEIHAEDPNYKNARGNEIASSYSGIDSVKYWVECDGEIVTPEQDQVLYQRKENESISSSWSKIDVNFDAESCNSDHIVIYVQVQDLAGNSTTEKTQVFKVITKIPEVRVSFAEWDQANAEALENYQRVSGFYPMERTAIVEITDHASCFDEDNAFNAIIITLNNEEHTLKDFAKGSWRSNGDTHTLELSFAENGRYTLDDGEYVNNAKLTTKGEEVQYKGKDPYKFFVDTELPAISLEYDEEEAYNGIFSDDVAMKLTVDDEKEKTVSSGIQTIEYRITYTKDGNTVESQADRIFYDEGASIESDKLQAAFEKDAAIIVEAARNYACDVQVTVTVTDNAGNTMVYYEKELDIDNVMPKVSIAYTDSKNDGIEGNYFTARTATVTVIERTEHFNTDGFKYLITAKNKESDVQDAYTITWSEPVPNPENSLESIYTATIEFAKDANYTFTDLSFTDRANNTRNLEDEPAFSVDTTSPFGSLTATATTRAQKTTWNDLNRDQFLSFAFWDKQQILVEETNDDLTSGVASVQYYMHVASKANDVVSPLDPNTIDSKEWKTFPEKLDVSADSQFVVYMKIIDRAGNYSYVSTNGLIVDKNHPNEEQVQPVITVDQPHNGIYRGNVTINITVEDPMVGGTYSGLNEVRYAVFDRTAGESAQPTQSGTLYNNEIENPTQSQLVKNINRTITVDSSKNNSNNIQVVIYAVDNAGNAVDNLSPDSQGYTVLKIDTTAPEVTVTPAEATGYHNEVMSFTVTVRERNFDENLKPSDVIRVSVKDIGVTPVFSGWTFNKAGGNEDNNTHTATVTFERDGVYAFYTDFTDLAGWQAARRDVGDFTIDRTAPVINVSYDNNNAANGKYFNAPRTATVVITEHNFDPAAVTFTPARNVSWSNEGDRHVATIPYAEDGDYVFDVSAVDIANNRSEPVNYGGSAAPNAFTVDTTYEDMITIRGVEDSKAYGFDDEVKPEVEIHDTNFDSYELTLTGAQRSETVTLTRENLKEMIQEGSNGMNAILDLFKKEQNLDGIYTLYVKAVDKAGNVCEKSVRFTVNRYGSVYEYDKDLMDLIAEGGTYNQSIEDDMVFTIYNASPINRDDISVVVTRDGKPVEVRFNVRETSVPNGWYSYVVTVGRDNFNADGVYAVSSSAKDSSDLTRSIDNTSSNPDADIRFFVDRTAPQLTSVSGLEERVVNATELSVSYTVYDTIGLSSVQVLVDGQVADYADSFEDGSNYSGSFTLTEHSSAQHVSFVLTDKAGNVTESDAEHFEVPYPLEKDVLVTTNLFIRWFANKPVFFGSIAAFVAALTILILLIAKKKKKDDKEEDKKAKAKTK